MLVFQPGDWIVLRKHDPFTKSQGINIGDKVLVRGTGPAIRFGVYWVQITTATGYQNGYHSDVWDLASPARNKTFRKGYLVFK